MQKSLNCVILRTSRFFQDNDNEPVIFEENINEINRKLNEYIYRRVSIYDVIDAHILAMEKAHLIKFDIFIISSKSPLSKKDCINIEKNNKSVEEILSSYYPEYVLLYKKLDYKMFDKIDRVYSCEKAIKKLGYKPKWSFIEMLKELVKQMEKKSKLIIY